MLRPSQDDPCGRRGGGGDDGAEDAGYPPSAAAAVLERFAGGHNLCRGDAPRFISCSAAAPQGEFAAQRRCCVQPYLDQCGCGDGVMMLLSINADDGDA